MSDVESGHKGDLKPVVDGKDNPLVTRSDLGGPVNENGDGDDIARIEKVYRYVNPAILLDSSS